MIHIFTFTVAAGNSITLVIDGNRVSREQILDHIVFHNDEIKQLFEDAEAILAFDMTEFDQLMKGMPEFVIYGKKASIMITSRALDAPITHWYSYDKV